jgi:hypothetical protein
MESTAGGGNLIRHRHVVQTASRPRITIGPRSNSPQPQVRLNKNGDRVESIEIQCTCGEKIVVQCEYGN